MGGGHLTVMHSELLICFAYSMAEHVGLRNASSALEASIYQDTNEL